MPVEDSPLDLKQYLSSIEAAAPKAVVHMDFGVVGAHWDEFRESEEVKIHIGGEPGVDDLVGLGAVFEMEDGKSSITGHFPPSQAREIGERIISLADELEESG